jgi:integrase
MKFISPPGNLASKHFRFGPATKDDLFTADEVRRLLERSPERLRLFVLLMINCGMYQSDISDLGESEVDWDAGTIERPRSKTGKIVKLQALVHHLPPRATFSDRRSHQRQPAV